MVGAQVITDKRLATVLVHALQDLFLHEQMPSISNGAEHTHLVTRSVSETREERNELASDGSIGVVLEDDGVELSGRVDLGGVAHKALSGGIDLDREMSELTD